MEDTMVTTECKSTINDKDKKEDHKIQQRKQNNKREEGRVFLHKKAIHKPGLAYGFQLHERLK